MNKNLLKTLIAASVITGTIGNNIMLANANELEDLPKDDISENSMLRKSHADIFPIKHSIMGTSETSKESFKSFLKAQQKKYGFEYKLTCSIEEWVDLAYEEARVEGVRADIVVAQAIKETGYFKFGGILTYKDNNFAGIGVTGKPGEKNSFPDARTGIRAQVQHLKAYATTDPLVNTCVDPRFNLVSRASAPSLEELAGKWAFPGYSKSQYNSLESAAQHNASYGQEIYKLIEQAKGYNGSTTPDIEEESETTNPQSPTLIAKGKVTGISSKLNVRSGAGTNYSVVGSLKNAQSVNIYEKLNGWYKIDYSVNGTTNYGYVSSSYVNITENMENPTVPAPEVPNKPEIPSVPENNIGLRQGQVIGISSRLNVRNGAGTNYSVVTTVTNNSKVTINSEHNGWYNVTLENGKVGYVSSKYIKVITNSSNSNNGNNSSQEVIKRGKVTNVSTVLNVRNGASTSSGVISYLRNNDNVEIIGESGSWYKIKSSKSSEAYVSKQYIKLI